MGKKRSVKDDVRRFCGYEGLLELAGRLSGEPRAGFAGAFLTGGRISEVLALKHQNFTVMENDILVRDMLLKKRYEKVGDWIEWRDTEPPRNAFYKLWHRDPASERWWRKRYQTKRLDERRVDFSFRRSDPLAPVLEDWLGTHPGRLFQMFPIEFYKAVRPLGIYPHWIRAQRASSLISFWGFTMEQMMEWMGWEDITTARRYAKMGWSKLAEKQAAVEVPAHLYDLASQLRQG